MNSNNNKMQQFKILLYAILVGSLNLVSSYVSEIEIVRSIEIPVNFSPVTRAQVRPHHQQQQNHQVSINPFDRCLPTISCSSYSQSKYRTIDGTCNNLNSPFLGSANRPYRKAMQSEYSSFGLLSGGKNPSMLPAPREIVLNVHKDVNAPDERLSTTMMSFGQFISHTMIQTSTEEITEPFDTCCRSTTKSDSCFPIEIPSYDVFFRQFSISCRNFKRSPAYCPQNGGLRLQTNMVSSFLDGSVVYGSNEPITRRLRLFKGGLMRMGPHSFLPDDPYNSDFFESGDTRSNQNPLLTAMHTTWLREHNRIATALGTIHFNWNDEILFQESRRILIAEFQNVIYNEYLRYLLSPTFYFQLQLNVEGSNYTQYVPSLDPTVTAEMSGAGFRMGHSMINGNQALIANGVIQKQFKLSDYFFKPKELIRTSSDLDMLIEGITTVPNQKVDRFITSEIGNRFGRPTNLPYGIDLISTNIQRGRDHGIPSYTSVRRFCNLPSISFSSSVVPNGIHGSAWQAIKSIYKSEDEIDLFTGSLSEIPLESSAIGPTLTCIISTEFYRRKFGDRYFFTHFDQPSSFTIDQLYQIKQRRLFDIFCDNTNIQMLAPLVFLQPIGSNVGVPCNNNRRKLDLSIF